jgi:putative flavoprotein involved in K+ transport
VVDGTPREVANVVWATGFQQVFDWIHLPILGEDGYPRENRGVVDEAPGLFFCGLCFQYSFSSMLIAGAGRDAGYVVDRLVARRPQPARLPTAA